MRKRQKILILALLLGGICLVVGVLLLWRMGGPSGPGRQLVGEWEVLNTGLEDAVKEAIEKKDPEIAPAVGEKFRSTERMSFHRNGTCRHVQTLLGLTITVEGNWQVTEGDQDTLQVKFHKKKLSIRDDKGQTREKPEDMVIDWVVSVVDPDRLSVTRTDNGKSQQFALRRARD